MKKEFSISNDKVMINFTAKYCNSFETLLESEGFSKVVESFIKRIKSRKTQNYQLLLNAYKNPDTDTLKQETIKIFRMLTIMSSKDAMMYDDRYLELFANPDLFVRLIEDLYSYWRRLDRYAIIHSNRIRSGIAAVSFTEANGQFSKLILDFYRTIEKNVLGDYPNVYRQLHAGGNACLMLNDISWPIPDAYKKLEDIPFIDKILLETPFITYPRKNTRDGVFSETYENPLKNAKIIKEKWFCFPAKVGELIIYVYFHRDFMEHGVTLCNLFQLALEEEYRGRKPDLLYIFGAEEDGNELKTVFFDDQTHELMVGYVNHHERIDYFGYMKKMILTLHNLVMIKRGFLPIHGAMVNIVLRNGSTANVVIVGDSGAGKSESLEAFRSLSEEYIRDMTIVFDDMGSLKIVNEEVLGFGTEIGAFVRLDDLDQGYAFKEIDRSIFMNPDKTNARLVMPISTYKDIMKGYPVDLFLYANNYDRVDPGEKAMDFFKTPEAAIKIFRAGTRFAKGTTTETGLVNSYFANPFGPVQKQEETDILLKLYFETLFKCHTKVGQIKTGLGILGQEKEGPLNAALELFEFIKKLQNKVI